MTSDHVSLQRGGVGPRAGVVTSLGRLLFVSGKSEWTQSSTLRLRRSCRTSLGLWTWTRLAAFLVALDRLGVVVLAAVDVDVVDSVPLVPEELQVMGAVPSLAPVGDEVLATVGAVVAVLGGGIRRRAFL